MKSRQAFEEWAKEEWPDTWAMHTEGDLQCKDIIDVAWDAWQAAEQLAAGFKKDAERLDFLERQRKWGDSFAVMELDSDDVYVRPWRTANEASTIPGIAAIKAHATIRAAIDAAISAMGDKHGT